MTTDKGQRRDRPRIAPATVSREAVQALDELAETFYAGKKSRAIDAALLAWVTVLRDPATFRLASKPNEALAAFCAARDGRRSLQEGRDAQEADEGDKGP